MSTWEKLSKIDCSKHTEKKGSLTYLSWAWAWSMVKDNYPDANYMIGDNEIYPDGTVMVTSAVTIDGLTHGMWLPVMDNRNNAVANPTSRAVSDARMRCLVKCIAMHGLGAYIYAGEDLPESEPYTAEQLAHFKMLVASEDGWGILKFSKEVPTETLDALFNSAPKGEKVKLKDKCRALAGAANKQRVACITAIHEALVEGSITAIDEVFSELSEDASELVMAGLTEIELMQIDNLRAA